ncbi:hypothetical protein GCM10010103_09910 [Streptomyces paradoxus]|uniref:Alcohol dehydrogenase-like C-terminal domain-containing protein n=1 Tax=Streptomyces paradoxus TaxID=66375 RepID=A0A7W9WEK8_9ACTN|nr:hypothetical protein [Streptomyces paradoxus]
MVRKKVGDGVDGLVDTAGVAELAVRAVRDGGRVTTSVGGARVPGERGIVTRHTFVPQYPREHAELDRLRRLAEQGRLTPRTRNGLSRRGSRHQSVPATTRPGKSSPM